MTGSENKQKLFLMKNNIYANLKTKRLSMTKSTFRLSMLMNIFIISLFNNDVSTGMAT
jgi:hypothetical protein